MIKALLIISLATSSLLVSCSNNAPKGQDPLTGDSKYKISLFENGDTLSFNLEKKLKNIEFKPLIVSSQTNSFLAEPKKIYSIDKKYYVLDKKFAGVKIYDQNGEFVNLIGKIGEGPGEFKKVDDFVILGDKIYLLANDLKIIKYDLDGKYLSDEKTGIFTYSFAINKKNDFIFYMGYNFSDKGGKNNISITDEKYKVLETHFPFETKLMSPDFSGGLTQQQDGKVLFSKPFGNQIYSLEDSRFSLEYSIDFNDFQMPEKYLQSFDLFQANALKYSYLNSELYDSTDMLMFSYQHDRRDRIAFYDKKLKQTYKSDDFKESYLKNLISVPKGKSEDGRFLCFISPEKLLDMKQDNEIMKDIQIKDPSLYKIVSSFKESDNPILMYFNL